MGFLNIQTNFYAFGNYTKDQGFVNENVNEITAFVISNQHSKFLPYLRHILTTFKLAAIRDKSRNSAGLSYERQRNRAKAV